MSSQGCGHGNVCHGVQGTILFCMEAPRLTAAQEVTPGQKGISLRQGVLRSNVSKRLCPFGEPEGGKGARQKE